MMRTYADSTLMSMKKSDLIECLRCAEHNQAVAEEQLEQHIKNVKGWVPVVRCRDCEFSRELTKTEARIWLEDCRACESPEASQSGYMIVFPEHFCSYGKRRNE